MTSASLDHVNRTTYAGPTVGRDLAATGGPELSAWSDPGEQAAIGAVAPLVRGGRILDVGVGAGRTTTFLRLLSDDYVGIDYTPALVQACRSRHPGAEIRVGDARRLDGVADTSLDCVVFSYNGIDSVDHDDRALVLREFARVLRPGGVLQLSTLNLDGPCRRATPLRPARSQLEPTWSPAYRLAMRVLWWLRAPVALPRTWRNYSTLLARSRHGSGWAVAPMEAYDFGLLVHYVTLGHTRAELDEAGFDLQIAFDAEHGRPVTESDDLSGTRYFQLVARRR